MNDNLTPCPPLTTLSQQLGHLLSQNHLTCSTAESCTGGMIGAAITSIAGSSEWFKGGVIAYSNEVKQQLLGVPEQVLREHGAVSAKTVAIMAEGIARVLDTDCAVSVSGIAGPGGGTDNKPVGLVYIGVWIHGCVTTYRHQFSGNRTEVRNAAAREALNHLTRCLMNTNNG